jgi:NADP-dependent 3-hydroxy acid dehydrogenase YdfG
MSATNPLEIPSDYEFESIAGKSVVVTGGTTGIGRATARLLASQGAKVLIFGRDPQALESALKDMPEGVVGLTADTTNLEDIQKVFEAADARIGGVDILINNAAEAAQSILDTEYAEWEYVVRANILGYFACAREAAQRMEAKGFGHIVNIGSLSAKARDAGSDVYVATKCAIEGFSESLRKQVNEKGIKVTLVEPGKVGADFPNSTPEEQPKLEAEGKQLKSEDIAASVYFTLIQPRRCDVILMQVRPHKQSL